jgi:hypothetical protein
MLNTIEPFETRYVQRDGFIDIYTTQPLESLLEAMDTTEAHALGLTGQTLQSLRAFFDGKGHSPSPDHWLALWAIANTLEAMASGIAQPKIYLSAVDPGVGKTQTVLHFARHLVASVEHRGVGMLISAFTIAEVADIAKQLEGISNSLWVRTSDSQANALGGAAEANEAQILITTQAGLGKLTKDQTFAAADALYYRGEPRACRVWDESLLPGSTAVLESGAIVRMGSRFELRSQALYAALLDLGTKVRTLKENEAVDVPDLVEISGMPMEEIREVFSGSRAQEDTENALFLSIMSGRTVRAKRSGKHPVAVLSYREELAHDLPPMLVLDASGRIRETYLLWESSRGNIERLPSAVRDYSPLAVKLWRTSGAKSGWQSNAKVLAQGIVDTILTKPDEKWLMVAHKPSGGGPDAERLVRSKLPPHVRANLEVTTWGRHTGSNDWADIPNVILAGTLFKPDSANTALHHLCAGLPVERGLVTGDDLQRTVMGEHRHGILQAVCRGRVRLSDGGKCRPMTAFIIAAPRSGIAGEIKTIFPGCEVNAWVPVKVEAKGNLGKAVAHLRAALSEGAEVVTYATISEAIGMNRKDFSAMTAKNGIWTAAVGELGCSIERGKQGALSIQMAT